MSRIQLGIAPINWTNDDLPELGGHIPLEQCLSEMSQAGYTGTEIGNKFPKTGKAIKEVLTQHKLQLASAWHSTFFLRNSFPDERPSLETKLKTLEEAGAKCINICECSDAIHGLQNTLISQRPHIQLADWHSFTQKLNEAGKLCSDFGISLTYHHHMGTVIQDAAEVLRLLESTDDQNVFLCFDSGHLTFAGADPLEVWQRCSDRVRHIHLKDVRTHKLNQAKQSSFLKSVKDGIFTVPGDGTIDFNSLVTQIVKSQYAGWLIVEAEQDPQIANPFIYARNSYLHLQKILDGLEL